MVSINSYALTVPPEFWRCNIYTLSTVQSAVQMAYRFSPSWYNKKFINLMFPIGNEYTNFDFFSLSLPECVFFFIWFAKLCQHAHSVSE